MIHYFNSPFLYFEKCENHQDIKKEILPLIENDYQENKVQYRKNTEWTCKSTSSFHQEYDENNINEVLIRNELLFNSIFKSYNSMLDELLSSGTISEIAHEIWKDCYIKDSWYNYYEVGEDQEIHQHYPNTFSVIYLLDMEGVNNTVWNNGPSNFPCEGMEVFDETSSKLYDLDEGNIIIFPSLIPHYVPPVKSKKISISFNIRANE
jgi:hypothetical protein